MGAWREPGPHFKAGSATTGEKTAQKLIAPLSNAD